jgi:hypothetical protein
MTIYIVTVLHGEDEPDRYAFEDLALVHKSIEETWTGLKVIDAPRAGDWDIVRGDDTRQLFGTVETFSTIERKPVHF